MAQIVTQTETLDEDIRSAFETATNLQEREETIGLGAESFHASVT